MLLGAAPAAGNWSLRGSDDEDDEEDDEEEDEDDDGLFFCCLVFCLVFLLLALSLSWRLLLRADLLEGPSSLCRLLSRLPAPPRGVVAVVLAVPIFAWSSASCASSGVKVIRPATPH